MKCNDEFRKIKEAIESKLLSLPGVVGVDIGQKIIGGNKTEILAIRVYVKRKLAKEDIPESELIPKDIQGVPSDVIERRFALH